MKLLRKNKDNKTERFILKSKFKEFQNKQLINSDYSKIKSNKIIKIISKNSDGSSLPILLKEDNVNKRKMNVSYKTSVKFLSNKNNNLLGLDSINNINKINRKNILNKTNKNIRIKIFSNFHNGKEITKTETLKENSSYNDFNNISTIKLSKKSITKNPINIEYNKAFRKKRFRIRYNLLLDNILIEKEKEFDKNWKIPSDKNILKKFIEKNNYSQNRKIKKPILNEYIRDITVSFENKKNIPKPYKYYLTKTKHIYNNLDKTYSFLKDDIKYDLIHDKEKQCKSEEKIKRLLHKKYDEIDRMIDCLNIKKIPLVDNYIKNKENKNQMVIDNTTWSVDGLKNLNEDIAYKHRKYFANKYGIEYKKNMLDVDTNVDDFLIKYQKNLNN
jgi:hypothetical protein